MVNNKFGQIWVETVIYTLIAFVLIGAVLAFVKPKIEEIQDKAIIDQSIALMKDLDGAIREIVQGGSGNRRKIELSVRKGDFIIDGENDLLMAKIESRFIYSEPGRDISDGNLIVRTDPVGDESIVTLTRTYDHNITFEDKDQVRTISRASTPYSIFIENKGKQNDTTWLVDFEIS